MDMREINQGVIAEFRDQDGQLSGPMEGAPILLLTTSGRRTGNPHTTPLGFIDAGGRLVVAAANGGSDANPDWFRNLESGSDLSIELPGSTTAVMATVATGDERTELLGQLSQTLPGMSDHVAATDRVIPVVVLAEVD